MLYDNHFLKTRQLRLIGKTGILLPLNEGKQAKHSIESQ